VDKCLSQGLEQSQIGTFEATVGFPVDFVQGGNPDLEPEAADTLTVGLIITPERLPNWNFAIDFFDMEIEDGIGGIDAFNICFDTRNKSGQFCDRIQRGPTGDMVRFEELFNNRGLFSTHGIDLQVNYAGDAPSWMGGDRGNQLGFDLVWTRTMSYKEQENPASSKIDGIGLYGLPFGNLGGTAPKNRVAADFSLSTEKLGVILSTKWIGGTNSWRTVRYKYFGGPPDVPANPSIDEEFYADLHFRYQFNDDISVGLGIANLFDSDPPLMIGAGQGNTDTGLYDVFGRSYRVTFTYQAGGN
jgi:outer membrane receptor protein involved in Fe transport